jgi:hypothetical protein
VAWAAAEAKGHHGKFEFLQEWARGTTGGNVSLTEVHGKHSVDYDEMQYTWVTKMDLYEAKRALQFKEMREYCDKLLSVARTKKHPDPKLKNDPDMKLFRILKACIEGRREDSVRKSEMRIEAAVDADAQKSVVAHFATRPRLQDDSEEKVKKARFDVETQRKNKVKADLAAAAEVLKEGGECNSPYVKPVLENVDKTAAQLKQLSHKIHEESLLAEGANIDKLWADVAAVCKALKSEFDAARSFIFPGAFTPYATQWDSAL